ncbi:MAG: hypothetical protein A2033_05250 [Bacteroidetes bacterium GWA2_31_9]|nr:MAG: hypothetical protein A2033_05250 [Bacteroidetes bacterium GWA2_31_9]
MLAYRNYKGGNDDDFFSIRLILDPINTIIQDNQETEVFFIESSTDSPVFEIEKNTNFDNYESNAKDELEFDFPNKKIISENDKKEYDISNVSLSLKKITDSDKGILKLSNSSLTLMEFLFYQKPLGKREKEFYKKVQKRFENKFSIAPNSKFKDYVNAIKKIKKAEIVKNIYEEAFDELVRIHPPKPFNKGEISDLNVTSIALLHKNCFFCNDSKCNRYSSVIQNIIKFNGRVEKSIINQLFDYDYYYRNIFYLENKFPNVLLTSDGFFKKETDYKQFYNKFINYWENFWLFQIPHHGSKNNIDKALLSIIPKSTYKFINYGTTNRHKHPSQELIENIIITGNSDKIIPINEFNGIAFVNNLLLFK